MGNEMNRYRRARNVAVIIAAAFAASTLFLLLLNLWGLALFGSTVDVERFGTVGAWFQGLVQVLAVVAAGVAIRNDRLRALQERADRDQYTRNMRLQETEQERTRQRRQYQAVFAWTAPYVDPINQTLERYDLLVSNVTDAPVFEWRVLEDNIVLASSCEHGPLVPGLRRFGLGMMPDPSLTGDVTLEFVGLTGDRFRRIGPAVSIMTEGAR